MNDAWRKHLHKAQQRNNQRKSFIKLKAKRENKYSKINKMKRANAKIKKNSEEMHSHTYKAIYIKTVFLVFQQQHVGCIFVG